jgi:hypothetical protein
MQFTSINVSECSGGYSVTLNGHKLVDAEGKPRVFSSAQDAGEAAERIAADAQFQSKNNS